MTNLVTSKQERPMGLMFSDSDDCEFTFINQFKRRTKQLFVTRSTNQLTRRQTPKRPIKDNLRTTPVTHSSPDKHRYVSLTTIWFGVKSVKALAKLSFRDRMCKRAKGRTQADSLEAVIGKVLYFFKCCL